MAKLMFIAVCMVISLSYCCGALFDLQDYQDHAKAKMNRTVYDFIRGGSDDEWTLNENREAYSRIRIRPEVLVDVNRTDLSTSVLGYRISSPIMIAPTSLQKLAHPDGELATARAAAAKNSIMVLSSSASSTIEEVAETGSGVRFFQLYIFSKSNAIQLISRAEKAGYKAIVVTVDTAVVGKRKGSDLTSLPSGVTFKNIPNQQPDVDKSITWKDIKDLMSLTKLPFIFKGILTKESAKKAVAIGAAGIVVSNHGGRQLDQVSATISVLKEVVSAVDGKIPVYIDGGIRRGTDVFKALALGARGVFIGRPVLFGLAVDGKDGVKDVLQILEDELQIAMELAGCPRISSIKESYVQINQRY